MLRARPDQMEVWFYSFRIGFLFSRCLYRFYNNTMQFDDEDGESDEEENDEEDGKKPKKYVPPKMMAVRYEGTVCYRNTAFLSMNYGRVRV